MMQDNEKKNEEAKRLIARLAELKTRIEEITGETLSDKAFTKRYTPYISETQWSGLKNGTYYEGKLWIKEQDLKDAIADIESRLDSIRDGAEYSHKVLDTTFFRAIKNLVKRAKDDPEDRRIIVSLAPTGYGKTAVAKYLISKGAYYVEGTQSWKSSYRAFCADVARAINKKVPTGAKQDKCEEAMIDAAKSKDFGTLVIDEANTLSGPCANGIKEIVNRTNFTVVLLAIPEFWDKFLEGNAGEVRQVVNRCQRVIRQERITTDDVRLFLRSRKLPEAFAGKITGEADKFGGFRTVISIMNEIADDPTEEGLDKSLERHRKNYAAFNLGR